MDNRIVITGLGFFSGEGSEKEILWNKINESYVLPSKYDKMADKRLGSSCAYDISSRINVDDYIENKKQKRLANFSKVLCIASKNALKDAKINKEDSNYVPEKIGTIVTTVHGPMNVTFDYLDDLLITGPQTARPFLFQQTVNNVACGQVAIENKLKGVSSTIVGASSIAYAVSLLRKNLADVCLVAGIEELHPYIYSAYGQNGMLAIDDGKGERSIPCSSESNGIVLGEGSGVLIIERYESAKRRNVHIYAEILEDAVVTDDTFCKRFDEFHPDKSTGFKRAMKQAIEKGNVSVCDIGFISLAANSLPIMDSIERETIRSILNDEENVGYVSSKAIFGETLGASEVLGTIVALLCMEKKTVPGLKYINNGSHATDKTDYCLVNSVFTGGNVNSLLLKKDD